MVKLTPGRCSRRNFSLYGTSTHIIRAQRGWASDPPPLHPLKSGSVVDLHQITIPSLEQTGLFVLLSLCLFSHTTRDVNKLAASIWWLRYNNNNNNIVTFVLHFPVQTLSLESVKLHKMFLMWYKKHKMNISKNNS